MSILSAPKNLTRNVLIGMAGGVAIAGALFYSDGFINNNNERDAIINKDGSFSSLISMRPRLPFGIVNGQNLYGPKIHESLINVKREEKIQEWVREKIIITYINISQDSDKCDLLNKWRK